MDAPGEDFVACIMKFMASSQLPGDLPTRVAAVIAKTQKIPPETVTIDKTFEELKIDSLDGINIMFALEEEFGVEIPDEPAHKIRSVREMVEGIEKLLALKNS
jgi:acyl carrier protein